MNLKKLFVAASMAILSLNVGAQIVTEADVKRAEDLCAQMTLEEKIDYIGGFDGFYIRGIDRLGIPKIRMADGPQGVRNNTKSTFYPCGIGVAATWNRNLANLMGQGMGQDARARGVHMILGPGVNIYRSPLCGRNFEYMGEDPYLAGETSSQYIMGLQSQGVMACIKHFAGNNSEWARHSTSSDIDDRTLHEIYLPTFEKAATKAGVGAIMCSYNLLNSVHSSESQYLGNVLRNEWGFDRIFVSDWTSAYSTLNVTVSELDLEMPEAAVMSREKLMPLIENGVIDPRFIDRKVVHILQTLSAFGLLDNAFEGVGQPEPNEFSDSVALAIARESLVLLKNEGGLLPMAKGKFVVCGPNADVIVNGGGSGAVTPIESTTVLAGMRQMGKKVKVETDEEAIASADAVVVCLGFSDATEMEQRDRTFELPEGQEEYLESVLDRNSNVIVVINGGGAPDMSRWIDRVKAVIMAWYPGQRGGLAVAEAITGRISPSGKLPISVTRSLEDLPSTPNYHENVDRVRPVIYNPYSRIAYNEGIFVGYRGIDKAGTSPLFEFGFGLSYSAFEYSDLSITGAGEGKFAVTFKVKNIGKMDASEVAQVYVGDPECSLVRPIKELKGYEKIFLKAGESKTVTVTLDDESFRFYDAWERRFKIEPGRFIVSVGASSRDIRLVGELQY